MSPAPGQVVVAGASLAGLRTVEALRRAGYAGRIVVVGAEREMTAGNDPGGRRRDRFRVDVFEHCNGLALSRVEKVTAPLAGWISCRRARARG